MAALTKSVRLLFWGRHFFVKMRTRGEAGVKYLAYLSVSNLWMAANVISLGSLKKKEKQKLKKLFIYF